ncbi:hypothetical protein CF336_g7247 [Tilletia laevis]|nr:hypothetical protein CF336_g7247 [Tilletia laevis]
MHHESQLSTDQLLLWPGHHSPSPPAHAQQAFDVPALETAAEPPTTTAPACAAVHSLTSDRAVPSARSAGRTTPVPANVVTSLVPSTSTVMDCRCEKGVKKPSERSERMAPTAGSSSALIEPSHTLDDLLNLRRPRQRWRPAQVLRSDDWPRR